MATPQWVSLGEDVRRVTLGAGDTSVPHVAAGRLAVVQVDGGPVTVSGSLALAGPYRPLEFVKDDIRAVPVRVWAVQVSTVADVTATVTLMLV